MAGRRHVRLERGRCSGSYGREYVRQITYYDALLYTNTNTYRRGPVSVYGRRHSEIALSLVETCQ